jgi:hypothetical protein
MTYGEILQLIPTLANRKPGELIQTLDVVRRSVKWAFTKALNSAELNCFYTFADVEVSLPGGLEWEEVTDVDAEEHTFSRISAVSLWSEDLQSFLPVKDFVLPGSVRFREILRQPLRPREFTADYRPDSNPTVYIKGNKLYITWLGEDTLPTSVRLRLEGSVGFPSIMDEASLNEAQLAARNWFLNNGENYLVVAALSFIYLYLGESQKRQEFLTEANTELANIIRMNSGIEDSMEGGITLD